MWLANRCDVVNILDGNRHRSNALTAEVTMNRTLVWWPIVFGTCDRTATICSTGFWANWNKRRRTNFPESVTKCCRPHEKRRRTDWCLMTDTMNLSWRRIFAWTPISPSVIGCGPPPTNISPKRLAISMPSACWIKIPSRICSHSFAVKIITFPGEISQDDSRRIAQRVEY